MKIKKKENRENTFRLLLLCDKSVREKSKITARKQGVTLTTLVEKLLEAWIYNLIDITIKDKDYSDRNALNQSNLYIDNSIYKKTKLKIVGSGITDSVNNVIEALLRYYNKNGFDFSNLESLTAKQKEKAVTVLLK